MLFYAERYSLFGEDSGNLKQGKHGMLKVVVV